MGETVRLVYEDTVVVRGLRDYVTSVAELLGVGVESCTVDPATPASAYIALEHRLAAFPDREVALLWDERDGWTLAVEPGGDDTGEPIVVERLGEPGSPDAGAVARFVERTAAGALGPLEFTPRPGQRHPVAVETSASFVPTRG